MKGSIYIKAGNTIGILINGRFYKDVFTKNPKKKDQKLPFVSGVLETEVLDVPKEYEVIDYQTYLQEFNKKWEKL